MVLSAHIVVGAAIASALGSPELALPAAFVSHYLMDAVPHREYQVTRLVSGARGGEALKDLWKVAFDIATGFGLLIIAAGLHPLLLLAGFLAILPDGGSFIYFQLRARPASFLAHTLLSALTLHSRFHNLVHWWKPEKTRWPLAVFTQGTAYILSLLTLTHSF